MKNLKLFQFVRNFVPTASLLCYGQWILDCESATLCIFLTPGIKKKIIELANIILTQYDFIPHYAQKPSL